MLSIAGMIAALDTTAPDSHRATLETATANDNRQAAGRLAGNSLEVNLDARLAGWRPDLSVDSLVTVMAFAETGKNASIPGPLIRARAGTRITVTLSNSLAGTPLVVTGLRAGTVAEDTVQVAPGSTRTITFTPNRPGTYMYWGARPGITLAARDGRDSQLTGAIVIDPEKGPVDRNERIMVLTLIDIFPDSAKKITEEIWEAAVNGMSWPHTERFRYNVGDTVRWRWVNGTDRSHPMHLHGFHFTVTAKGNGRSDSLYTREQNRLAVTEFVNPGATFAMSWVPARAGNWLMHCHMIPHITPFPDRPEESRSHDVHDVKRHPEQSMSGLVIGIITVEPRRLAFWRKSSVPLASEGAEEKLRLLVQEGKPDDQKKTVKAYVLQRGAPPARDSVERPSSTLLLTRGRTTQITVVNRLSKPTTIHWHGLELQSVYDGVSGWSGSGRRVAPLVAPGDSFTVVLTPPRAGTYMYHTHMDEEAQLNAGLYGAIIVQERGRKFDSTHDRIFIHGQSLVGGRQQRAINGTPSPAPAVFHAGQTYRLRIINLLPAAPARVSITAGADTIVLRHLAKDGAELPPGQAITAPRVQVIGVGEAYDFEWKPMKAMEASLNFLLGEGVETKQKLVVIEKP